MTRPGRGTVTGPVCLLPVDGGSFYTDLFNILNFDKGTVLMADLKGAIQNVRAAITETKSNLEINVDEVKSSLQQYVDGVRQIIPIVDVHYAIAGTAALDNSLRAALLSKMRPLSRAMRDRLFEGYGPLATVAAKIDLAYALEIIPKEIYDQLRKINKIRVTCAHSPELTTFSHPKIAPLLDTLDLDTSIPELRTRFIAKLKQIDTHLRSMTTPEHLVP